MSASEKLKALGERAVADRHQTIDQLRDKYGADWPAESARAQSLVYAALPQIVAVVEAAEWTSESGVYSYERHEALTSALAALDEALE